MAPSKRDRRSLLLLLINVLFLTLVLVAFSACGEDEETATTQAGETQTTEAAPAETDQVIDQAAVAAMDLDEFRAVMTTAADRLVAHVGSDDDALLAVLFAVDRGYDAYQLLTGSLSDQVGGDGRIAAADGSEISPTRTTTRIFSLPDDTADTSDRPILLASLAAGLFAADSTVYDDAEVDLGDVGVFPINDALGVFKAGFDASRAKVEAESQLRKLQEKHAKIALVLAARGYDARQITEAAILGQIRIFLEPVYGDFPNLCWYIEHTSGKVLRPVNPPLDIFAEMSCPAPDKEAPATYDREIVQAILDERGLGEYGPTGGVSGSSSGASTPGGAGAPEGQTPPLAEEGGPPDLALVNGTWKGTSKTTKASVEGMDISEMQTEGCDPTDIYRVTHKITVELDLEPDGSGTMTWTGDSVGLESSGLVESLPGGTASVDWTWENSRLRIAAAPETGGTLVLDATLETSADGTIVLGGTWNGTGTEVLDEEELDLVGSGTFAVTKQVEQ